MTNSMYICVGENYKENCRIGYCGDKHTLIEWLMLLIPSKTQEEIDEYFKGDKDSDVVEYLNNYCNYCGQKVRITSLEELDEKLEVDNDE